MPFDRRMWMQATSLAGAGYQVVAISPSGQLRPGHEVRDGIHIYRYPLKSHGGTLGHLVEYVVAFISTAALTTYVAARHGLDIIHTANPPDIFFAIALFARPFGVKFVYDQHDLVPEMCVSRWTGWKLRLMTAVTRVFEAISYASAHVVISTNESYRSIATTRGRVSPNRVYVVRSAPRRSDFEPVPPDHGLKNGRRHLVVYLGVMGPDDGVDLVIDAAEHIVHELGRADVRFVLIGDGDERASLEQRAHGLSLGDFVEFTGRVSDDDLRRYVCSSVAGLVPDPPDNPLNDLSSMNKVVEYMALGTVLVAYPLTETYRTAGECGHFVHEPGAVAFAEGILHVIDGWSPSQRAAIQRRARQRFLEKLCWEMQEPHLLAAYRSLSSDPLPGAI